MIWYKINEDHTTEPYEDGVYPTNGEFRSKIKHVGDTKVGNQRVSTVFLHMDHNWDPDGPPILFETMIFGGEYDEDMWRYSTWDEAKVGHDRIVNCLKKGINPND